MYEARTTTIRRKPRIILGGLFNIFKDEQVGDKGFCTIEGSIVSERKEMFEDGNEYIIKTVEIRKIEKIEKVDSRGGTNSL
jgi:predicted HicB family RNase H-like nuclease